MRPRLARRAPHRESLLLRFGIVSAVLAGILGVLLTGWLTDFIRTTNINHATDTAKFSIALSQEAIDAGAMKTNTITPAQLAESTRLIRGSVKTGKYVGATAWLKPDIVVYAVEPSRMYKHEAARPQVAQALAGQTVTLVVTKPAAGVPDPTERAALSKYGPLLEIFTPSRPNKNTMAAVVLYQPWRPVQALINRETNRMLLMVLAGLAVLWLGLMRLVLTASRKLRAQAEQNWHLAAHDSLTGLPNRKLLSERVDQALRASQRSNDHVGLLLFDLDRFKEVNDTLGHHVGDLLLEQIGPRLVGALRASDSVARLGGDEFVVLLPDLVDPAEAIAAAERLTQALATPFDLGSLSLDVAASIGIAISPEHGEDFETLLRHADIGMYAAKTSGDDYAVYTTDSDDAGIARLNMLGQLRNAMSDPSRFVLHYQPRADLPTGDVHAVEALAPWRQPEGMLPPSEFVAVAERSGLIHALTAMVLKAILTQLRTWNRSGIQLRVSVNISARCLLDPAFPSLVWKLLEEYEVAPASLEFEITEGVIMTDPQVAVATLTRLRELGIHLAIDNFGRGLSSMAHLQDLPVQTLKIDEAFVTELAAGSTSEAIVGLYIELAHHLGLKVSAEGVTTQAVWERLVQAGCDQAQGSFIAPSMPAKPLIEWLQRRAELVAAADDQTTLTAG